MGKLTDPEVQRFADLFAGYELAYGTYGTKGTAEPGEKVQGVAKTIRGAPSLKLYRDHLENSGLGLGIILLKNDDTCSFGAIDYDKRNMNHETALARVMQLKLPLVLCRSKSGGGHFYCFTTEPIPAVTMRERLDEWKALLGMSAETEVFPKQSSRFSTEDIGSWINIPYFNYKDTSRYAILEKHPKATLTEFLTYAETHRATPAQMTKSWVEAPADSLFEGGPPCLIMLEAQGGFQEGSRNNGMAACVVYLKKSDPEHWKEKVDQYNTKMAKLPSAELQEIVKSHTKKEYNYQCKLSPLSGFCQRRKCLKQPHGVGQGEAEAARAEIGGVTRYDPGHGAEPIWVMEIDGRRVRVSNAEFISKTRMNQATLAQANTVVVIGPQSKWDLRINQLVQNAEVIPLPEDASPVGQLLQHMENFCLDQVMATTRDGILNGTPFVEDGRVFFRSVDLFRYLRARKVEYGSEQVVYMQLKEIGAGKDFWHLSGGKSVNVWSVPAPKAGPKDAPVVSFATKEKF